LREKCKCSEIRNSKGVFFLLRALDREIVKFCGIFLAPAQCYRETELAVFLRSSVEAGIDI